MSSRAVLPLLCLSLAACQSNNPYTSESAPIPPPPPVEQVQSPIYPAAPRDFSDYQNWSWRSPPAATASIPAEELQEMVAGALDQRGLRPAPTGSKGDVQVSVHASRQTRLRHYYDDYGPRVGVGRYGGGYGAWGSTPVLRAYEDEAIAVYIEMYDGASGQPIWSNQAEVSSSTDRAERTDATREAVNRALADYPPK
ncbi:MAG: DUF4136 domain-containing protein [Pseudomonas sp.]